MKKFCKKHKKGLIILGIIVALIVAFVLWLKAQTGKAMDMLANAMAETTVAEKRDLVSVVSATGTVISLDSKDLTSIATGTKIKEVLVDVGDEVKEGDILVILDSEDYEKNLANAEDSLSTTQKSNNLSISSAKRRLDEANTSSVVTDDRYKEQIDDAKKKISDYKALRDQAENMYNDAVKNRKAIETQYNTAYAPIAAAEKTLAEAQATLAAHNAVSDNDPVALAAIPTDEANVIAAEAAKDAAYAGVSNLTSLNNTLQTLKASESAALSQYQSYITQVEQLESQLETIEKNQADAKRTSDSTIASSQDSLTSAKLSAANSTTQLEKQIEAYNDQIDACFIKAPFNGVVTSLNAEVGNTYAGALPLATVEDVSGFEITTEIDEYDIGKIKKGQRVVIKTNGTGDDELEGVVKSIAPRATKGAGVTYTVVISVNTKNDSLRLDMTARLSIVLEESKNTLTVPYDAVITDDDGSTYVKKITGKDVKTGFNTTENVYVSTGIVSDYYIEITSDNLKEGDEVEVERELSDVFDFSVFMQESATSGM